MQIIKIFTVKLSPSSRFFHLVAHFTRPSDYHQIQPNKTLHFVRSADLFVDWKDWDTQQKINMMVTVQGPINGLTPH
jgi:hypothetical protein